MLKLITTNKKEITEMDSIRENIRYMRLLPVFSEANPIRTTAIRNLFPSFLRYRLITVYD